MDYLPKQVICRLNFKNISVEEIMENCSSESEAKTVRKFYEKLDGKKLLLSLWNYDNHKRYHLSGWKDETDGTMMEAMFIIEQEFGSCNDFEKFKKIWKDGYDPGVSIVFPKQCVEELKVISEESNEQMKLPQLEQIQ